MNCMGTYVNDTKGIGASLAGVHRSCAPPPAKEPPLGAHEGELLARRPCHAVKWPRNCAE